jgi:transcriptional regulator of acetoin/glycerol metabolism
MDVKCPKCHEKITVKVSGRKKLEVPVKNIYDGLAVNKNITDIAAELGCSRSTIYNRLKDHKNKR